MLHICFGIYLVLSLPAIVLIWAALVAAKERDLDREYDHRHTTQIAFLLANRQNATQEEI